jgi:hypothetical protein
MPERGARKQNIKKKKKSHDSSFHRNVAIIEKFFFSVDADAFD